jgi:hypothetical protein
VKVLEQCNAEILLRPAVLVKEELKKILMVHGRKKVEYSESGD